MEILLPTYSGDLPKEWRLPCLFKLDQRGKERQWQIYFQAEDLQVSSGLKSGKKVTSSIEVVPKGKRSYYEQAWLIATHRYQEKIRKDGYTTCLTEKSPQLITKPMLATTWQPAKDNFTYPILTQPKLDGIRMLVGKELKFISRGGKEFHFFDHLRDEVENVIQRLGDVVLDGELYTHDLSFTEITGIARRSKNKHPQIEKLEYHLFDIIQSGVNFKERYLRLQEALVGCNYLKLVPLAVANSKEELFKHHHDYVSSGYEGLIIRKADTPYRDGRVKHLYKYKSFTDEEAEIIAIEEATGTEKGTALVQVRDIRQNQLTLRFRGSFDLRKRWLKQAKELIGKKVTFRYQELSADGIPRFPVGIEIRDYE